MVKPAPNLTKTGAERQIELVWGPGHWQRWDWCKNKMPKAFEDQLLTPEAQHHVNQDVLTPFAILYKATVMRAEHLSYREDEDVFP